MNGSKVAVAVMVLALLSGAIPAPIPRALCKTLRSPAQLRTRWKPKSNDLNKWR